MGTVDAVAVIQNEQVEQRVCIKFSIKLEHSPMETIQIIQKATARATGDRQLPHDNKPAHASHLVQGVLEKHQITEVTQPPTSQIGCPVTFGFSPN